jgi:nucleotide-binding universal stress UspA family protein
MQTPPHQARERAEGAPPDTTRAIPARILVALDASDHANRGLVEAVRLAGLGGGKVTGIHPYAAKLHDRRFRQMEGGLPERYREEQEMERQREVHDDLITRGLSLISDSYHDEAMKVCEAASVPYRRLSPEGKNYRRIVEAVASGAHDLLVLGAVGLGIVPGTAVGTVCARVVRRSAIDALVIRDPARPIGDGPLVVGLDGSARSFGALRTALELGRRLGAPVHAVAAYDPYFHYVAFNKISGTLSEEAGQEFRFKEQEKMHEEIIDSGIAKIYQSHLDVGRSIAAECGLELTCRLLDGKPHRAIARYLEETGASLLLLGKTGVHADPELDIGGNAENLLHLAPCHVWLGQASFAPPLDALARETITWTHQAEAQMARVPESPRAMVRMAILRFAQESGHTVITGSLIDEATARLCPHFGGASEPEAADLGWSAEAKALLDGIGDPGSAARTRLRAEKHARRRDASVVAAADVQAFLDGEMAPAPMWAAVALARLAQVPEMVRNSLRRRAEAVAEARGLAEVTAEVLEATLAESKQVMQQAMGAGGHPSGAGEGVRGDGEPER